MIDSLLEPAVLFFIMGLLAGILKSELRIPEAIYELLSIYLLIGIGLKGGLQLSKARLDTLVWPVLGTLGLGIVIPLLAYIILRKLGKIKPPDAAAIAAHYGSTSVVTFAVAQSFLDRANISYEGFMTLLLTMLEIPALIVAILIVRLRVSRGPRQGSLGTVLHEVFLGKSIYLLLGGVIVGFLAGPGRIGAVQTLFIDLQKGFLALFLLEMGLLTSRRLGDLRKIGPFLVGFGIVMPLISGILGAVVGDLTGLSIGGTMLLATLAASASYIAAPAAMRVAVPEANPTYYLTASLGITFPFNVIIGVQIYYWFAQVVHSIGG